MEYGYLYIISCLFLTIACIFLGGMTIRFYLGWFEEIIKKKVAKENDELQKKAPEV